MAILRKACGRCGERAEFMVVFPDAKKKGGKEKEGPCPIIWHCHTCQWKAPLTLAPA